MHLATSLRVLRLRIMLPLLFRSGSLPELMARLDGARAAAAPAPPVTAGEASRRRAEALVPLVSSLMRPLRFWSTTCLWRSLAGYAALKAAGDDVRFLIGVRLDDRGQLSAHAWLERAGVPSLGAPRPEEGYRVAFAWPADPATLARRTEATVDGIKASEDAVLTELKDGTGVLLHLGSKHYYTLNATGVLVWKLLSDGSATTAGALAVAIAARFEGADPATVRADVDALLAELAVERLVVLPG
jgi:hypothetical protein